MITYNPSQPLSYVYICRERNSQRFYIGYRYKNWLSANEDFGIHYFTSNEYVKSNFQNFAYEILAEFENHKDALAYESKLIKELRTEHMINRDYTSFRKPYKTRTTLDIVEKVCALPNCDVVHTNWRMKCCCHQHQKQYAGLRRHIKNS